MLFVLFLTLPCSILAGVTYGDDMGVCDVEGQQYPDHYNDHQYYECLRGIWNLMRCRGESMFFIAYGACMIPCPEKVEVCQEGQRDAVPENNQQYYECWRGLWYRKYCWDGFYYDSDTGSCQAGVTYDDGMAVCVDGQRDAVPENNQQYYECWRGLWYRKNCWDGYYYDRYTGSCQEAAAQLGLTDNCGAPQYCPLGAYFPDNCNCRKFYQCDHGGAVHKDCGPGTAWNPKLTTCDWPYKVELCKTLGQL